MMIYDTYINENSFTDDEYYTAKEQFQFFKNKDNRFKWNFNKRTEKWSYRNEVRDAIIRDGASVISDFILHAQIIRLYQPVLDDNMLWTVLYRQQDTNDVKTNDDEPLTYKITTEEYNKICYGIKSTEIRLNDRKFKIGSVVLLREYDKATDTYSGRTAKFILKNVIQLNDALKHYNTQEVATYGIVVLELEPKKY